MEEMDGTEVRGQVEQQPPPEPVQPAAQDSPEQTPGAGGRKARGRRKKFVPVAEDTTS